MKVVAGPGQAVDVNSPAVRLDDLPDNIEAEAKTAPAGRRPALEAAEKLRLKFFGDTWPAIADHEPRGRRPGVHFGAYFHRHVVAVFDRIGDQIRNDLFQTVPVPFAEDWTIATEVDGRRIIRFAELADDVGGDIHQIHTALFESQPLTRSGSNPATGPQGSSDGLPAARSEIVRAGPIRFDPPPNVQPPSDARA